MYTTYNIWYTSIKQPILFTIIDGRSVIVFNATFNNYIVAVSFISGENHRPTANQ